MTFRNAVEATPAIRDHLKEGLRALRAPGRSRVSCSQPRRLRGSVDLDQALQRSEPGSPRWDYAIGLAAPRSDLLVCVEVHPASSSHVVEVTAKLRWLQGWLRKEGLPLNRLSARFVWVASGGISIRRGSREQRALAQAGLQFPVKHLSLDQFSTPHSLSRA